MKKLMAIFAHPDDEGLIGGTLAYYARLGHEVTLVCATRGEVGEISDPALATPETLGEVRTRELEAACEALGIQPPILLDYRDSGMDGTPENDDPRALVQADPEEVIERFVTLIRTAQPDAIITFEPFGWYGHPDHRAVSRWATAAYHVAGDEEKYPAAGQPWRPQRLYHSVLPFTKFREMMAQAIAAGYLEEAPFNEENTSAEMLEAGAAAEAAVTHVINVRDTFAIKQQATQAHQTQFGEESMFRKVPAEMLQKTSGHEYFILVDPPTASPNGQKPVGDLLAE